MPGDNHKIAIGESTGGGRPSWDDYNCSMDGTINHSGEVEQKQASKRPTNRQIVSPFPLHLGTCCWLCSGDMDGGKGPIFPSSEFSGSAINSHAKKFIKTRQRNMREAVEVVQLEVGRWVVVYFVSRQAKEQHTYMARIPQEVMSTRKRKGLAALWDWLLCLGSREKSSPSTTTGYHRIFPLIKHDSVDDETNSFFFLCTHFAVCIII